MRIAHAVVTACDQSGLDHERNHVVFIPNRPLTSESSWSFRRLLESFNTVCGLGCASYTRFNASWICFAPFRFL